MKKIFSLPLYKVYKLWNNMSWKRLNLRRFHSSHLLRTTSNRHPDRTMKSKVFIIQFYPLHPLETITIKQWIIKTFTKLVHKTIKDYYIMFCSAVLRSGNIVHNETFKTELREICFVTRKKTPIFLRHRITSHVHLKK